MIYENVLINTEDNLSFNYCNLLFYVGYFKTSKLNFSRDPHIIDVDYRKIGMEDLKIFFILLLGWFIEKFCPFESE